MLWWVKCEGNYQSNYTIHMVRLPHQLSLRLRGYREDYVVLWSSVLKGFKSLSLPSGTTDSPVYMKLLFCTVPSRIWSHLSRLSTSFTFYRLDLCPSEIATPVIIETRTREVFNLHGMSRCFYVVTQSVTAVHAFLFIYLRRHTLFCNR